MEDQGKILLWNSNRLIYMENTTIRDTLSANIRLLMQMNDWDQKTLANKAGIAQKTISNMATMSNSASIDNIAKVAKAFRVPSWLLIMPGITRETVASNKIPTLVTNYIHSTDTGREYIDRVSEQESKYTAT